MWALLLPRLLPSLFAADEAASGEWWSTEGPCWQQHQEQQCLCTLLQVSKALQDVVGACCKGQLAISASPQSLKQAESFASWLSSPGTAAGLHMMRRLHLDFRRPKTYYTFSRPQRDSKTDSAVLINEIRALVTQALTSAAARMVLPPAPAAAGDSALAAASSSTATAAATPALTAPTAGNGDPPAFCEVDIREPSAGLVEALASLPVCHITRLNFGFGGPSNWSHTSMRQLGEALQRLTGIRTLALSGYDNVTDEAGEYIGIDDLIPSLSGLASLTSLVIQDYDTSLALPSQLHQLTCSRFDVDVHTAYAYSYIHDSADVELGNLTSLTRLTYYGGATGHDPGDFNPDMEYADFRKIVLNASDVLPPNLMELHVPHCRYLDCVLGCTKLRALHLESCRASANQLQQLSRLTSLAEVNVQFCSIERCPVDGEDLYHAAKASDAWVSIPLRSLTFDLNLAAAASGLSNASTNLDEFNLGTFSKFDTEQAQTLLRHLGQQTGLISNYSAGVGCFLASM